MGAGPGVPDDRARAAQALADQVHHRLGPRRPAHAGRPRRGLEPRGPAPDRLHRARADLRRPRRPDRAHQLHHHPHRAADGARPAQRPLRAPAPALHGLPQPGPGRGPPLPGHRGHLRAAGADHELPVPRHHRARPAGRDGRDHVPSRPGAHLPGPRRVPVAPGRHRSAQPAHHRRGGRDARARERGLRRRPAGDAGDAGHPGLHPRGRGAPALHERERAQPGRGASSLHAPDLLLGRGQPGDRPRHRGGGVGRRPPRARRLPDRRQPGGVHLLPGLAVRSHQQHVPGLRAGAERPGGRAARPRHDGRGAGRGGRQPELPGRGRARRGDLGRSRLPVRSGRPHPARRRSPRQPRPARGGGRPDRGRQVDAPEPAAALLRSYPRARARRRGGRARVPARSRCAARSRWSCSRRCSSR